MNRRKKENLTAFLKFLCSHLCVFYMTLLCCFQCRYCVAGTIGHKLMSGKPTRIDIDKDTHIDVRCQVAPLNFYFCVKCCFHGSRTQQTTGCKKLHTYWLLSVAIRSSVLLSAYHRNYMVPWILSWPLFIHLIS